MFASLFNSTPLLAKTTFTFCKMLHANVTQTGITNALENHPDYPSLLSVSDCLTNNHIENVALKVTTEEFGQLPTPLIANIISNDDNDFVIVKSKEENTITYLQIETNKEIIVTADEFYTIFKNVVLLAEATEKSIEATYKENVKKEAKAKYTLPFIGLALILLISVTSFLYYNSNPNVLQTIFFSLLLVFSLAGLFVSILLLWYEIDKMNPTLQKICTGGGNNASKTNCNAILNSSQAKLFNSLSWSELGFYYFVGYSIILVLFGDMAINTLAYLTILALPYTIFSIYYQALVVKQWCRLCLAIQGVLIIMAALIFGGGFFNTNFASNIFNVNTLKFALVFLVPIIIWAILKPNLLAAQKGKKLKKQHNRLKYNQNIFDAMLEKQQKIELPAATLGITMGNPNAKHTIIKVCNPYCGPCAAAHKALEDIIAVNSNVKMQLVFTATNNEGDMKSPPAKHLLAINEKEPQKIKHALDAWYLGKEDYESFAKKHPISLKLETQNDKITEMEVFCKQIGISYTPTIFINGQQMPDIYNITDINYFLN